jgi:hypothetical protein
MLHIGTNKIAQNINPEMPAQQLPAVKSFRDSFSADSFFSILKNQIQTIEQSTAAFSEKSDMLKNDASVSAALRERSPYEPVSQDKPREDAYQAVGTTTEQTQKTSTHGQDREAKTNDDVKGSLAQKPAAETEPKKAVDKDTDAGARVKQKQKSKTKKDEPDMYELYEGLHRMMDIIKGREQSETRQEKQTAQELNNIFRDLKTGSDSKILKKTLDKITALVEKLEAGTRGAANGKHLAGAIAGIKDFLTRVKTVLERNHNQKNPSAADGTVSAARDLLGRIETLLESLKGDSPFHRTGRDSQGNNDIFNFGHIKNDLSTKHTDAPAQPKGGLFRENLDAIIQNARVFVQDNRNGSFSIRLHPRELGSLNINLGLHDGVVHGKFLVGTQEAKDLLLNNLELIKQQLQDAGISVGEFQVNVNGQRGKLLHDGDRDGIAFIPPAELSVEIESEYASNAKSYHDGHINLVI